MQVALRSMQPLPEAIPPSIMVSAKQVPLTIYNDITVLADLPEGVIGAQVITMLSVMFDIHLIELQSLPGQFKIEIRDVNWEMERLVDEQERDLAQLREIAEPVLELNPSDPYLEAMVPIGKKIWDSIFVKPTPVVDLQQWLHTSESDEYVYLPNDASKMSWESEQFTSNAMYTEVMVNAYNLLCQRKDIRPKARLVNGLTVSLRGLTPIQGSQHTVPGENASRLANSKLIDFDDSGFATDFLECICDLRTDQYESEPIRRRVLAKVEHILMGRTSHTYNQRFIHALYNRFVNELMPDDPWADHRVPLTNCILSVVKQMVMDGLVLEDSKEIFLHKLQAMGFGEFSGALSKVFDQCGGRRGK